MCAPHSDDFALHKFLFLRLCVRLCFLSVIIELQSKFFFKTLSQTIVILEEELLAEGVCMLYFLGRGTSFKFLNKSKIDFVRKQKFRKMNTGGKYDLLF